MADNRASVITLGLCEIQVGAASAAGTMPQQMAKIGKTYKDTCKMTQDAADVTEHYEEGKAAPEVRKKSRKMPTLTFSMTFNSIKVRLKPTLHPLHLLTAYLSIP